MLEDKEKLLNQLLLPNGEAILRAIIALTLAEWQPSFRKSAISIWMRMNRVSTLRDLCFSQISLARVPTCPQRCLCPCVAGMCATHPWGLP